MRGGGRTGFTLVEIMIVVAIIAILAAIAIPQLIESRKMARLNRCMNNLRILHYAKEQLALNLGTASGEDVPSEDVASFLKDGYPTCPSGGGYDQRTFGGGGATCSYHGAIDAEIGEPTALSALTND